MLINWYKDEPYRWIGTTEDQTYELWVEQIWKSDKWQWKVFRDEDKIIDGLFEDDDLATNASHAKYRAENALDAYLEERNNLNNILSEAMADEERKERENFLENKLDELDYKNSRP